MVITYGNFRPLRVYTVSCIWVNPIDLCLRGEYKINCILLFVYSLCRCSCTYYTYYLHYYLYLRIRYIFDITGFKKKPDIYRIE